MALTPKQEKFCQCIVSGMSGKDSYLSAYDTKCSDKVASNEALVLLKRDDITERIAELNKPCINHAQNTAISEREKKRKFLWDVVNDNNQSMSDRLRSMDLLNKMDAEYININQNIDTRPAEITELDTNTLRRLSEVV